MCLMNELIMVVFEFIMFFLIIKAFCKVWIYVSVCVNFDWFWKNGIKYLVIGVMIIIFFI